MENRRNYYRVLQVQHDAPFEVIKASYHAHLRELKQHPDFGGNHTNATILNEAYSILSDHKKRAEYDKILFNFYTKRPFSKDGLNKQPTVSVFCPFCKQPIGRNGDTNEGCLYCKGVFSSIKEKDAEINYRRSEIRLQKQGKIHCYATSSQMKQEANLIDISTKGMRFVCKRALNLNMVVKIRSPFLNGVAKVINVQHKVKEGTNRYLVGINFSEVVFKNQEGSFFSAYA